MSTGTTTPGLKLRHPAGTLRRLVRHVLADALYRGSLLLFLNTAVLAAFGFVFWVIAARSYPSSVVGQFSGILAGVTLLSAAAALGLPNTLMRFLPTSQEGRQLAVSAITLTTLAGAAATTFVAVVLGPHLPEGLGLAGGGTERLAVILLAVATSVNMIATAGLIAVRASGLILVSNAAGSIIRIVSVVFLAGAGLGGLIAAYLLGAAVPTFVAVRALWRRLPGEVRPGSIGILRTHMRFSLCNYAGTLFAILPLSLMPLLVLAMRGRTETAWFTVAFLLVGFVNFIPATTAQVLLSEVSRAQDRVGTELFRALRYVYALQIPLVAALLFFAPSILGLFGAEYADGASNCLRLLSLGALIAAGNYLVDNALAALDRVRAYAATNAASTVLVIGLFAGALPFGLTAAAAAWAASQLLSLLVGILAYRLSHAGAAPRPTGGGRAVSSGRAPVTSYSLDLASGVPEHMLSALEHQRSDRRSSSKIARSHRDNLTLEASSSSDP